MSRSFLTTIVSTSDLGRGYGGMSGGGDPAFAFTWMSTERMALTASTTLARAATVGVYSMSGEPELSSGCAMLNGRYYIGMNVGLAAASLALAAGVMSARTIRHK